MEESTSRSCSTKSCSFSFCGVLKAGFFAAILTNLLMIFQGNNALFYFGTLFLGSEADPKFIYTVGVLVASVLGIVFAFIYALIIAPLTWFNDLIKAIVLAIILTVVSYYASPELPKAANMITGHAKPAQKIANPSSDAVSIPESEGKNINDKESTSLTEYLPQIHMQKAIVVTFTNSLLFALMVVALYKGRCYRDSKSKHR